MVAERSHSGGAVLQVSRLVAMARYPSDVDRRPSGFSPDMVDGLGRSQGVGFRRVRRARPGVFASGRKDRNGGVRDALYLDSVSGGVQHGSIPGTLCPLPELPVGARSDDRIGSDAERASFPGSDGSVDTGHSLAFVPGP